MNRTASVLAISPGLILQPCSTTGMTVDEIKAAGRERAKREHDFDQSWIPAGAICFDSGIPSPSSRDLRPYVIVITDTENMSLVTGRIPGDAEFPCSAGA